MRPSKLSPQQVEQIRQAKAAGARVADLAAEYGVTTAAIYARLNVGTRRRAAPRTRVVRAPQTQRDADRVPYPEFGRGYIPRTCQQDRCGQPQDGPGHPRKGWIQTKRVGETVARWHCSWHCLSRHAIHVELAGGDA